MRVLHLLICAAPLLPALACVERPEDAATSGYSAVGHPPPGYPPPGYPPPGYPPSGYRYPPRSFAPQAAPVAAAPAPAVPAAPAAAGPVYDPDPDGRPTAILRTDAPNMRYAALDAATCEAELTRRGVPFARAEATDGVMAPERLRGPVHGVTISTGASEAVRMRSSMEIFDCRLVLALDDFAAMAAPRGITRMLHISAYRPKSANGCTAKYPGLQHCGALAVDIAQFRLADGTTWSVQKDFAGQIGAATCGPTARPPAPTRASIGLHALVCDAAAQGIFNVILTPDHNAEHFNHFHVEVTPGAEWMLIQ
ncbi:MAG: extensin family protein [Polyangiaceae bacterium]